MNARAALTAHNRGRFAPTASLDLFLAVFIFHGSFFVDLVSLTAREGYHTCLHARALSNFNAPYSSFVGF